MYYVFETINHIKITLSREHLDVLSNISRTDHTYFENELNKRNKIKIQEMKRCEKYFECSFQNMTNIFFLGSCNGLK